MNYSGTLRGSPILNYFNLIYTVSCRKILRILLNFSKWKNTFLMKKIIFRKVVDHRTRKQVHSHFYHIDLVKITFRKVVNHKAGKQNISDFFQKKVDFSKNCHLEMQWEVKIMVFRGWQRRRGREKIFLTFLFFLVWSVYMNRLYERWWGRWGRRYRFAHLASTATVFEIAI